MKITRSNYEAFFLDYSEGRLSGELLDAVEEFMQSNPDLADELIDFSTAPLVHSGPEALPSLVKNQLRKDPWSLEIEKEFDLWAIARMEGDLDAQQQAAFDEHLRSRPDRLKDYRLFEATRLQPEPGILFKNKGRLKHLTLPFLVQKNRWGLLSLAASLALVIGVSFFLRSPRESLSVVAPPVRVQEPVAGPAAPSPNPLKPADEKKIQTESTLPAAKKARKPQGKAIKPTSQEPTVQPKAPSFKPSLSSPDKSLIQDQMLAEQSGTDQSTQASALPQPTKTEAIDKPAVIPVLAENGTLKSTGRRAIPKPAEDKSLTVAEYFINLFNRKVLKKQEDKTSLSGWDLAYAGAEKINQLTGSGLKVENKRDKKGRLIAYNIGTSTIGISKSQGQ